MQKFLIPVLALWLAGLPAGATEHHSGHVPGMGSGGGHSCLKPHVSKFMPPHLGEAAPGSEFSFVVMNVEKAGQIHVTVKNIPVPVNAEYVDPFFRVTGKLPASLRNTVARVNVKISAKFIHCEGEGGWLVKITE